MSMRAGLGPRALGIELWADDSDLFTGRVHALEAMAAWLAEPDADPNTLVVTGAPGSGKSALLARAWHERAVVARNGVVHREIDVAINAHGRTTAEVFDAICAVVGCDSFRPADLVIAARKRSRPLVALVDAVDEAAHPADLVDTLLSPLSRLDAADRVRLLIGVPAPVPARLAGLGRIVDLDAPEFEDAAAVAEYTARYLRGRAPEWIRTASPDLVNRVASTVASAAGRSFFTAHVVACNLADRIDYTTVDSRAWTDLPDSPKAAVEWDLRTRLASADVDRAEDLLAPLAFAEGVGLPWEDVWAPAAAAASGRPYTDADLAWLRRMLGWCVLEVADTGRLRFRLCHEVVAEHLRARRDPRVVHAAIAGALVRRTPPGAGVAHDWSVADSYTRAHLASHAAAGGVLDELLVDPGFLLSAERPQLLAALPAAVGLRAWELSTGRQLGPPLAGQPECALAAAVLRVPGGAIAVIADGDGLLHQWDMPAVHHRVAPTAGDGGPVHAVAAALIDGRPFVVAAGRDNTIRVWDLVTGRPAHEPLAVSAGPVTGVALVESDPPTVVSCGSDGVVQKWQLSIGAGADPAVSRITGVRAILADEAADRVWVGDADGSVSCLDGPTGKLLCPPLRGHTGAVTAAAATVMAGEPVLVTGGADGGVRRWSRLTGQPLGRPWVGTGSVLAVAAIGHSQRCFAVFACGDGTMELWEVAAGAALGRLGRQGDGVVGVAEVSGRLWAVSGSSHGTVTMWDMVNGRPGSGSGHGTVLGEHSGPVTAIAATVVGQRLLVVSGGVDRTAQRWLVDVGGGPPRVVSRSAGFDLGHRLRLNAPVTAIATRPSSGSRPMSAVAADRVLQLWLAAESPQHIEVTERVTALAFSESALLVGTDRGVVAIRSPGS